MSWQPIETAPKDRTDVLLWLGAPYNEVAMAFWYADWGVWVRDLPENKDSEMYGIGRLVPTHWMPLPPPPAD